MTPLRLSHFTAAVIVALFASIVFGITQKSDPKAMLRYGGYCFGLFVGGTILGAWVMAGLRAWANR
jgi:hypothetical protein